MIVAPAKAGPITTNVRGLGGRATPMGAAGTYYVYILASGRHGTLYIGVTNNLRIRLKQHRSGRGSEFVKKYGVHRLVHAETFASPQEAIAREKQLKKLAPRLEDTTNRGRQSRLERLVPSTLNSGGYGSRPSPGRRGEA